MNRKQAAIGAVVRAAVLAALIGLAAGCGSASSSSSGSPSATAPASTAAASGSAAAGTAIASESAAAGTAIASASASAAGFAGIVEPWDPDHPARTQTVPAVCTSQLSTAAIEQCYETKTENTDAEIDAAQQVRYASASPSGQAAILAQDSAWLAAREPVCAVAFHTGGSIDGVNIGACLLDESAARLDAVTEIAPPEAMLKSTDDPDPDALSWYTTPEGSRIAPSKVEAGNSM